MGTSAGRRGSRGIRGHHARWRAAVAVLAVLVALGGAAPAAAATDSVDEIMYAYGDAPGSVVLLWRGSATTVQYGATSGYGLTAAATVGAIVPVDSAGPFQRALLTGLTP